MQSQTIMGRPLDAVDVAAAAKKLNVTTAHVRAIMAVEASGSGFIARTDGTENRSYVPKILFEAHVFSKETRRRFDGSYPHLSSPSWNRDLYAGGLKEYDRLNEAADLDFMAAYRSTSWGLFQIMGLNHLLAGYDRLEDFIGAQFISEGMQLQCGVRYIQLLGLDHYLRLEDWRGFAKAYNGPRYEENRYHEKLAQEFERYSRGNLERGSSVKELQAALDRLGFRLTVDGIMGSRTKAAIREFQEQHGLVVDGTAGPQTRRALGLP